MTFVCVCVCLRVCEGEKERGGWGIYRGWGSEGGGECVCVCDSIRASATDQCYNTYVHIRG